MAPNSQEPDQQSIVIAGRPAPTGSEYIRQKMVGSQAAIASRLAPTEEQNQNANRLCLSPLNRMSVSSAAALDLDLDPRATSAG
jgi:hypothetical protein